jgi:hypothetical protein
MIKGMFAGREWEVTAALSLLCLVEQRAMMVEE